MKNERLARAISELDEDLIAEAHEKSARKPRFWQRCGAIAACFMLVLSLSLWRTAQRDTAITVFGEELTAQPMTIAAASPATFARDAQPLGVLALSIELKLPRESALTVSGGTMQVFAADSGILLCEGTSCTADGSIGLIWLVETETDETSLTLTIENAKETTTVALSHAEDGAWTLQKITD